MSEPIVPCLKEAPWGNESLLRRPLWGGTAAPTMPWVAFGYDQPHTFEFLNRDHMREAGRGLDDIEREALANLRERSATWAEQKVKVSLFKKLRLLCCLDDFLSAERILDRDFMREAEGRLKTNGLLVGVPRRGLLFALSAETHVEFAASFLVALVTQQFQSLETASISPLVFAMRDGEILGVINAEAEAQEEITEGADVRLIVVREEGDTKESIHVIVTHDDFDVVARSAINTLAALISEHGERAEFSGKVRFVIPTRQPEAIEEAARSLEAHLQGILAEIAKGGVRPCEVSVRTKRSTL